MVREGTPGATAAAHRLQQAGADVWWGDVTKPATIAGVCDGARAAVSALGVRNFKRTDGSVWTTGVNDEGALGRCTGASGGERGTVREGGRTLARGGGRVKMLAWKDD